MPGRVEAYTHSDESIPNKIGCLVEVTCDSDFGAKTEEFSAFCKHVAMMICGHMARNWNELVDQRPCMMQEKKEVEEKIGERVEVTRIALILIEGLGYYCG